MQMPINQPEILFFPAPNLDGTFQVSWGEKVFKNGLSVYRFKIIDKKTAHFWVAENEDVYGRAITSYNNILLPVCEEKNLLGLNHTKIVNEKVGGIAKLNNDIWEVVQKAKIRYEWVFIEQHFVVCYHPYLSSPARAFPHSPLQGEKIKKENATLKFSPLLGEMPKAEG